MRSDGARASASEVVLEITADSVSRPQEISACRMLEKQATAKRRADAAGRSFRVASAEGLQITPA